MMPRNCPKCDSLMEFVESDPDTGIDGNVYVCTNEKCGEVQEPDDGSDYMDDAARDEANHRGGS